MVPCSQGSGCASYREAAIYTLSIFWGGGAELFLYQVNHEDAVHWSIYQKINGLKYLEKTRNLPLT